MILDGNSKVGKAKVYQTAVEMSQAQEIDDLKTALEVAANQLEGVSLAIKTHGQNIDTEFFIREYAKMAKEARNYQSKNKNEEMNNQPKSGEMK